MRYLLITIVFMFTAIANGNEVASSLLSKTSEKAEQKLESAINDMFDNTEVDLSGFKDGKPSFGLSSIIPIYDSDYITSFFQGHLSTQSDIEIFNIGFVQRRQFFDSKLITGFNLFYDYDLEHSHERWSLGGDLLTSLGDIHLNYYEALTEYKYNNGLKEITLGGYDVQVAFPLPYLPKSKFYAETFSWNGVSSSRDLEGETFSLKSEFPYGVDIELGKTSYDYLSQDEEFISLKINLLELNKMHKPFKYEIVEMYSNVPYESLNFSSVSDRRFEKVRRENKIKKQTNRQGTVKIVGY